MLVYLVHGGKDLKRRIPADGYGGFQVDSKAEFGFKDLIDFAGFFSAYDSCYGFCLESAYIGKAGLSEAHEYAVFHELRPGLSETGDTRLGDWSHEGRQAM